VIGALRTDRPRLVVGSPVCSSTGASAAVTDESPVTVVLSWRQGQGTPTESPMTRITGDRYGGRIGPVTSRLPVSWFVTAVDGAGNRAVSPVQTVPVGSAC
jgi:hypothetical protein